MAVAKQATGVKRQRTEARQHGKDFPIVPLILCVLSFLGMMVSLWMIFLYAPTDAVQGDAQRIFYFHVPMAWVGMLSFVVLTVAGIIYLWKGDEHWDWVARAAAEVGAVFLTLALILGSIWGKTTWGTWWTWDPKLTTTLILWFIYIAYIMLRNYMGRTPASARSGAVLAIISVIDVPIIYESVNWWRTLHPPAQVGVEGALPPEVVLTLVVSLVTFTLLYSFLMVQLYQLERMQTLAQRLRATVEE